MVIIVGCYSHCLYDTRYAAYARHFQIRHPQASVANQYGLCASERSEMCQLNVPMTTPQLQHQRPWAINVHLEYRSYPCGRSRRRPGTDEAVPSAGAAKAACSSERQCGIISRYHCRKLVGRRTRRLGRRSERRHRRRNVRGICRIRIGLSNLRIKCQCIAAEVPV